ncbi:unnamed protein product [Parajaminaea phylloscopi]
MELPLYRRVIKGTPLHTGASYGLTAPVNDVQQTNQTERDETEDLYELLLLVKRRHPDIQAVSVGAILSNYQRVRVETICSRPELALQPLAFLWQRDQGALVREMVAADVDAVLIKVAGAGLDVQDLGKSLATMLPKLNRLSEQYGSHICGEGGEYETLTLDCPLFKKSRIELQETELVLHSDSGFASVAFLRVLKARLVDKHVDPCAMRKVRAPPLLDACSLRAIEVSRDAVSFGLKRGLQTLGSRSSLRPLSVRLHCQAGNAERNRPRGPLGTSKQVVRRGRWVAFSGFVTTEADCAAGRHSAAFFALREELMKQASLQLNDVQHLNLSIASQADFIKVNAAYRQFFILEPPTRATVALPHLRQTGGRGAVIQLDGIAYDHGTEVPDGKPPAPVLPRQTLHVQSLSYWAAANIGPYSQAANSGSRITIAGQIALVPADLSALKGRDVPPLDRCNDVEGATCASQLVGNAALSLQHARRVLQSLLDERARTGHGWVEGGCVWLGGTSQEGLYAAMGAWGAQNIPQVAAHGIDLETSHTFHNSAGSWPGTSLGRDSSSATLPLHTDDSPHVLPLLYIQLDECDLPRHTSIEWQLTAHDGRRQGGWADFPDEDECAHSEAIPPVVTCDEGLVNLGRYLGPADHDAVASMQHRWLSSPTGGSHFGVATFSFEPRSDLMEAANSNTQSAASSKPHPHCEDRPLVRLREALRSALTVRVFVDVSSALGSSTPGAPGQEVDSAVELLGALLEKDNGAQDNGKHLPAVSGVSALGLYTAANSADKHLDQLGAHKRALQDCQIAFVWCGVEALGSNGDGC